MQHASYLMGLHKREHTLKRCSRGEISSRAVEKPGIVLVPIKYMKKALASGARCVWHCKFSKRIDNQRAAGLFGF